MENLIPLLEKLAETLGVTTKILWEVMIKQAPISGCIDIIQYIIFIIACIGCYKITIKSYSNVKTNEVDDIIYLPLIFAWIILSVVGIVCFFCIGDTVIAFVNPEYWALDRILTKITPSGQPMLKLDSNTVRAMPHLTGEALSNADDNDVTSTGTVCTGMICEHKNGFYDTVYFWIFRKRVFVCTDCERILEVKG